MKKEKLFAALFGAIVGLILAVIVLSRTDSKVSLSLKEEVKSPAKRSNISPTVSPIKGIKVLSPLDNSIVRENRVKLVFEVPKDSLVVVASPVFEKAVFTKEEKVEIEVELSLGENRIKIYSYPTDPTLVNLEREIVVYYLERKV